MLKLRTTIFVCAALVAPTALLAQQPSSARSCDRGCLLDAATQYLHALVSHDPSSLSVAATVASTGNRRPVRLEEGMWTRAQLLSHRQTVVDPVSGQVVIYLAGIPLAHPRHDAA